VQILITKEKEVFLLLNILYLNNSALFL